jgi:hypothetical protein
LIDNWAFIHDRAYSSLLCVWATVGRMSGPPGIWQESGPWKVYVEVLGALDIPDNKNPYVKLTLGNLERQTKRVNTSIAPAWYQEYEFDLVNPQSQLQCSIMDPKKFGSVDIVISFSFSFHLKRDLGCNFG